MFTPFKLRELVIPNRVVVSPMCQYSAVDGMPNDWHLVHLGSRALGGAGLIFTEMTDVSAEARISPGCAGLYRDEHVPAWRRIVDFVHRESSAKIAVQLGHAGRKGATRISWEGDNEPLHESAWDEFETWLREHHADDMAAMLESPDDQTPLLTPESIGLWEQHTAEFVAAQNG